MKKILLKIKNLMRMKTAKRNIKVTSDINQFKIGTISYNPTNGQQQNPSVNWFYLLEANAEQIRCFNEDEAQEVIEFLQTTVNQQFGNNTNCFINNITSDCNNNECENEVANGIRNNAPLPSKIKQNDFGINHFSNYTLDFDIIGYLY